MYNWALALWCLCIAYMPIRHCFSKKWSGTEAWTVFIIGIVASILVGLAAARTKRINERETIRKKPKRRRKR